MTIQFTVTDVIPASPQQIFDAWLDSDGHTQMTGSPAHASSEVGGAFDAWDGHISGQNLELEPGRRILQTWKAHDYTEADGHSEIEVLLEVVPEGTRVVLNHRHVPDNQTGHQEGWVIHYFEPMKKYFGERE